MHDTRKIIIHQFTCEPIGFNEPMDDTTISLYYVTEYDFAWGKTEEGYVIEAKVKAVKEPKIKYITKDFFERIYNEFYNINFELLVEKIKANFDPSEADGFEIEMGIFYGYQTYTKKISFLHFYDEDELELIKIMKTINDIKYEINYDQWYGKLRQDWQEWRNKDHETIFEDVENE